MAKRAKTKRRAKSIGPPRRYTKKQRETGWFNKSGDAPFLKIGHEGVIERFTYLRELFRGWKRRLQKAPEKRPFVERVVAAMDDACIIELPVPFAGQIISDATWDFLHRWSEHNHITLDGTTYDPYSEKHRSVLQAVLLQVTGTLQDAYRHITPDDARKYRDALWTMQPRLASVKHPFDVTYFGYDGAVDVTKAARQVYAKVLREANALDAVGIAMTGHLVTPQFCVTFLLCDMHRTEGGKTGRYFLPLPVLEYDETRRTVRGSLQPYTWYHECSMACAFIPQYLDWVNDHKTIIEDDARLVGVRKKVQRAIPRHHLRKSLPPPYYVVYMADVIKSQKSKQNIKPSNVRQARGHRSDVRAHDRIYVKRGPLPLDPKLKEKLLKPRPSSGKAYEVFEDTTPHGVLAEAIWKRGIARKEPNEWMAILVARIDHHISPRDESLPYIPSVRRSVRHKHDKETDHVS